VRPSERLTLVASVGLAAVTAAVQPQGVALRLLVFLGIGAATLLLARAPARDTTRFVRDWLPVGEVLVVFLLLQPVIEAAVPWRLDAALDALDARYLAGLVGAWRGAFGRPAAFTDAMYLAYCSYYFLPLAAAVIAWRRGPEAFGRVVFPLLLGFYLSFLGYLLLPALGPRLPLAAEAGALGGGAPSDAVRAFLHAAEATTLDAFPSGHTAVAVIAAAGGARLVGRAAAVALWLWAAAVVFSTVYIHVHYAVDIVAGLALAALVLGTDRARGLQGAGPTGDR
jgi:membrane-associated phospholipid phosphatase